MEAGEIYNLIDKLKGEIAALPSGCVAKKVIRGKERYYHQYKDGSGKMKYRLLQDGEVEALKSGIEKRRELGKKLKRISAELPQSTRNPDNMDFECSVTVGKPLIMFAMQVAGWERRDGFERLNKYLYSKDFNRVCVIYGLRRTGKSTMLRQAVADMSEQDRYKAAYIKIRVTDDMGMLNADLKLLQKNDFKYVFIDEITLMKDFINTASILSDVFAAMGMKIVLSGTDSLGFWFALDDELYDRAKPIISTTFIPFKEFSRVLKIDDIDDYIRYGGTLRAGETAFDDSDAAAEDASFRDDETTRRYIDTAICKNIQHSLACYKDGRNFRHLQELYDNNELTGAINRIIEDMNHRFVVDVLTREFKSNDLGLARNNFNREKDPEKRNAVLEVVDIEAVTERLKNMLDIRNTEEQKVGITPTHVAEIKEYLKALDLIADCPIEFSEQEFEPGERVIFTQPGMRYCQAQALVYSLDKDDYFKTLSELSRRYVTEKILEEVRGRMLEDMVLLETLRALNAEKFKVCKFMFARGEYDMLIYNKAENTCEVYEIKHSLGAVDEQARHLRDSEKICQTERRFGKIVKRCVLYRGQDFVCTDGIEYQNVEKYLKEL